MRSEYKEANKGIGWGLLWAIALVVILVVGGAVWWGIGVAISGPKGQGDAIRQNNSAENWTAKQAWFEETYAEIEATDKKLDIYAAQVAANPNDKTAQQTFAGIQSYCLGLIGEYDAEARKFLSKDWRSPDLPQEISTISPSTDCKENV